MYASDKIIIRQKYLLFNVRAENSCFGHKFKKNIYKYRENIEISDCNLFEKRPSQSNKEVLIK